MRNVLLVPTDFSKNAWTATIYAAQLASRFNWNIHLLHAYEPLTSAFAEEQFNAQMTQHASNKAIAHIDELAAKLAKEFPHITISSACIQGSLGDILPDIANTKSMKFVVMGTKGVSSIKSAILGSNTYEIIQKSPIGVLAIPENYKQFRFEKIGLLTNFKESEINLLQTFTNRTTTALETVLLHIHEAGKPINEEDVTFWTQYVQKKTEIEKISYRTDNTSKRLDSDDSIPNCIQHLTQEEAIDVLLVSYNRKNFFKHLFGKNLTKTIVHNLTVPTFFYNEV